MNLATNNLENDHANILRLTNIMEQMIKTYTINLQNLEIVVSLIEEYADDFHHSKEENVFFPYLVKRGFSSEQGPVAVMLHEHDEGRKFTSEMRTGIENYKANGKSALPDIYQNMQNYIDLLRGHIGKENNILFKMADRLLTGTEQEHILRAFKDVENKNWDKEKIKKIIFDIEQLEAFYSV